MNKTIGIVAALPGEARALVGRRFWRMADGFFHCRTLLKDDTDLLVVQSGMGMENAFTGARWLTENGVSALGCFGVSGGLDPELKIGDLVLADAVFEDGDDGASLIWKEDRCYSDVIFSSLEGGPAILRGPIITVNQAVLNASDKRTLFDRTGAMAVDMESAAVARAANRSCLPFFAVRAICDTADMTVPKSLFQCIDRKGRPRFTYLLRLITRRPSMISHLLHMKRNFTAALAGTSQVRNCLSGMHISPAP
jgi:adenosylhomocysteine nucleosidase